MEAVLSGKWVTGYMCTCTWVEIGVRPKCPFFFTYSLVIVIIPPIPAFFSPASPQTRGFVFTSFSVNFLPVYHAADFALGQRIHHSCGTQCYKHTGGEEMKGWRETYSCNFKIELLKPKSTFALDPCKIVVMIHTSGHILQKSKNPNIIVSLGKHISKKMN